MIQAHRWLPFVAITALAAALAPPAGAVRDIKLGVLTNLWQAGHEGTYPTGTVGLAMATTSCNVGDENVQWHAPMAEDHPGIAMQLYREMNGRFEQIGVSWLKHGFFALSDSECDSCEAPSNGTFLGVGCSDTYGAGNNSDRFFLGPRDEWDPYTGTWSCTGSFFSDYEPDCEDRRRPNSSFGPTTHRLVVRDPDLGLPGATYYYEAYYLVRDDAEKMNNIGSRVAVPAWNGERWLLPSPQLNNPLVEGPAILRWGEMHGFASAGPADGDVILAVSTTDLGGSWQYDYGLFNFDSDREVRSFQVPIGATTPSAISFHDPDQDAGNDWTATIANGTITWETGNFGDPNANALVFGYLFSFSFLSTEPPMDAVASLGMFQPGPGGDVAVTGTRAPGSAVTTGDQPPAGDRVVLGAARPNPTRRGARVPFELSSPAFVRLDLFDPAGRLVRTMIPGRRLGAGTHQESWNGTDTAGLPVPQGVYYYRLTLNGVPRASRSLIVVE